MDRKLYIKNQLKQFKNSVNKEFPIRNMYFFGSRANGKAHKWSDIDLIIVSPKFRKLDFFKRGATMYNYWKLRYPVDFLCYTPEEFKKMSKGITIISEAIKSGIRI